MVWRCVAAVAAGAVGLTVVVKRHGRPVAGAGMAGRALARVMVRRRIPAMAAGAVGLAIVVKGHRGPVAGAGMAG